MSPVVCQCVNANSAMDLQMNDKVSWGSILWLIVGIPGSVLAGLLYGFLAPIMATFDAVGEGKENTFVHCFVVNFLFVKHAIPLYLCSSCFVRTYFTCLPSQNCRMEHGALLLGVVQLSGI